MRSTEAVINLDHLRYNLNNIRKKVKKSKVMAVVKADAYGHGMPECAAALSKLTFGKPDYYGVALVEEGIELRKSKVVKEPIVSFAPFNGSEILDYQKFKIYPSITSSDQIKQLKKLEIKKLIYVHVNVNTGMNRLGINYDEALSAIKDISLIKNIKMDGIYTHFASSDEKNKSFANLQLKRFKTLIDDLKKININYGLAHCANSAAILDMPDSYLDMVRPGISLYGYYPSLTTSESFKLKPVMSLYSRISTIIPVNKDETVGYGRTYKARRKILSATLPVGYADGLRRELSNKIKVIINNKFAPLIGRISMDRISVDVTDIKPKIGTNAVLIGTSKNKKIDAWDWAKILNTIPYEITCAVSKRVRKSYIGME